MEDQRTVHAVAVEDQGERDPGKGVGQGAAGPGQRGFRPRKLDAVAGSDPCLVGGAAGNDRGDPAALQGQTAVGLHRQTERRQRHGRADREEQPGKHQ